MQLISIILNFLLIEVADVLAAIGGTSGNPAKYDLEVEDLNNFCPLVPGFDEFDTRTDSRSNGKACYKYHWTPDPCTMEKSGRTESDLLHCGHYSMIPCVELNSGMNGLMEGLSGYDLPWDEVNGLCDVVNIKDRTTKKRRNIKPMYWKWTFCANDTGTEERPCGHYSMEVYHGKDASLRNGQF